MQTKPDYAELLKTVQTLEQEVLECKRSETTLRESEQKWKHLFDLSPIGIVISGPDYRFKSPNAEFCRFIGYSEKELMSMSFHDITHPEDLDDNISEIKRLAQGKIDHYQTEKRYIRKDGQVVWGRVSVRAVRDEQDKRLYSIPMVEDITARKKTEEALLESEKKFREIFEESLDAIFISRHDGVLVDANSAALELFGYTRKEAINKLNTLQIYMAPENRKAFQKEIEQNGFVRNYAVKFRKKNGEEMDCLLTARVRRNADGHTEGYHGIIRDVTEYKLSESALQESEARYRAIVEDQTEMICRFIPTKTLTFVNEAYCRYLNKKPKDLIGSNFLSLVHKPDQAEVEKKLRNLSLENPVTTYEHRIKAPDGTLRWQQWTSRMLLTEENHMIEFQAVGRDITEMKLIEEELRESSEKIKLFAYSILHDLKSPVMGIYGLTQLLQKNCQDSLDAKARRYTSQILKSTEIIAALVEQINLFITTKETPLNLEPINIKEILQIIKEEFSTTLNIRRIKWSQPKRLPVIKADRLSILRVLRNLVDNALKYGGDELKEIKIGYQADDGNHILSVYNDGAGIKSEDSQNIFKQFSRQKSAKVEGTGLGLAIVKEIAERHNGKVWVDSPKSKGATFCLSISKKL